MDEKERHLLELIGGITVLVGIILALFAFWTTV
jgi:hypothetical protein